MPVGERLRPWIDEWLETWTGNRPDELIKFYAPNAFYLDPGRPHGLTGHVELLPYFRKLLAANPDWVWRAVEVFPTSSGCCLKWKATIPIGNAVIHEHGLDIVEIDGDIITRNEVYFDRAALMGAIAQRTPE